MNRRLLVQCVSLAGGPLLCGALYALLPEHYLDAQGALLEFSSAARWTVGAAGWLAWWWLLEPVPLPVTSLVPALMFPLLGIADLEHALAPYADPLLFLFLGGFVLALAVEKWGLHRRFAYSLLGLTGGGGRSLVLAVLGATAFISMWLSNTATAVLMLPVVLSIARHETATPNLQKCLMLSVAYGATIGGIGTLIGTPPNLFVASFLRSSYAQPVDFWTWLGIGLPVTVAMLPITWWVLTRVRFPVPAGTSLPLPDGEGLSLRWSALPSGSRVTLLVFAVAALAWTSRAWLVDLHWAGYRPLQNLSDTGIALAAAICLFTLPVPGHVGRPALDWEDTRLLPWGTLLLFGGGLSLADAITVNGVDRALGAVLSGVPALPVPLVVAAISTAVIFVSEIASNIATAAAMTPLLAAAAPALGLTPTAAAIATALGASSAYMMPVGTAPNALAYGSGLLTTRDMATTGFLLNLISIGLIVVVVVLILPHLI